MDQEIANKLFDIGGFAIFLAPPPAGMEFGIDLHSWELRRRFSGLKLIPPGFHFIHTGGTLGRFGWLHFFAEREVGGAPVSLGCVSRKTSAPTRTMFRI